MTTILAHRGNIDGPCPATENQPPALHAALMRGWGVETDIRRATDGLFYLSHDLRASAQDCTADVVWGLVRAYPAATIALNVKETGGEDALLTHLESHAVLGQCFLFDMEFIEASHGHMARRFRELHPAVRLAARVSDRGESVERALGIRAASIVWLDEFDRLWCTEQDVHRLKNAGRTVYAVSPDLHGFDPARVRERWLEFQRWGVDGICTDYPAELERVLTAAAEGAAV